ncbi:sortase domain-bontaining protein [Arthrobacter gengyunqii]|uniref:Sortase n=1 Tax=Arthrobacter gengyunqii TaxID=2886940 RepID=A0ABS8GI40_9MICC|nr:sortase [Arthrobacter gengyunqii]MCC3266292.1 sortase [Arthrobacter gengyunqii]
MSRLTPEIGGGRSLRATAAACLFITAGLLLPGCGTSPGAEALPPEPSASSWQLPPSPAQTTGGTVTSEPTETPSPESAREITARPRTLTLPSVAAGSDLMQVGLREDGTLEVPPGNPGAPAAWYRDSPKPGDPGPAVILGHVNADDGGPGVFANLRELQPNDEIQVQREDGSTAVFTVLYGEQYPKDTFPTEKVYGNTDGPELRLITCDGYDPQTGTFGDNYVVYARIAS